MRPGNLIVYVLGNAQFEPTLCDFQSVMYNMLATLDSGSPKKG